MRQLPSVTDARGQRRTDQWFEWATFGARGRLQTSYYDRQYGNDETTGQSDYSLSGSGGGRSLAVTRATSSSVPLPTQFDGTFWGDYTGLDVSGSAYPFWSDTRDPDLFACRNSAGNVILPPRVCRAAAGNGQRTNDQNVYEARESAR